MESKLMSYKYMGSTVHVKVYSDSKSMRDLVSDKIQDMISPGKGISYGSIKDMTHERFNKID